MANKLLIRVAAVLVFLLTLSGCVWYGGHGYDGPRRGYGYYGDHHDYPYRHSPYGRDRNDDRRWR